MGTNSDSCSASAPRRSVCDVVPRLALALQKLRARSSTSSVSDVIPRKVSSWPRTLALRGVVAAGASPFLEASVLIATCRLAPRSLHLCGEIICVYKR